MSLVHELFEIRCFWLVVGGRWNLNFKMVLQRNMLRWLNLLIHPEIWDMNSLRLRIFPWFLLVPTFPFVRRCFRWFSAPGNFRIIIILRKLIICNSQLFLDVSLYILLRCVPWLVFQKVLNRIVKCVAKNVYPLLLNLLAVNVILRLFSSA